MQSISLPYPLQDIAILRCNAHGPGDGAHLEYQSTDSEFNFPRVYSSLFSLKYSAFTEDIIKQDWKYSTYILSFIIMPWIPSKDFIHFLIFVPTILHAINVSFILNVIHSYSNGSKPFIQYSVGGRKIKAKLYSNSFDFLSQAYVL